MDKIETLVDKTLVDHEVLFANYAAVLLAQTNLDKLTLEGDFRLFQPEVRHLDYILENPEIRKRISRRLKKRVIKVQQKIHRSFSHAARKSAPAMEPLEFGEMGLPYGGATSVDLRLDGFESRFY